jgi:uncharacterized protein Usg
MIWFLRKAVFKSLNGKNQHSRASAANILNMHRIVFSLAKSVVFCCHFPVAEQEVHKTMVSPEFERQMEGYGLTTAHIFYRLPDFQSLLQTYVWQDYDLAPDFPGMRKFLDFWEARLDGKLHSVRYAHQKLIGPNEWRRVDGEILLN